MIHPVSTTSSYVTVDHAIVCYDESRPVFDNDGTFLILRFEPSRSPFFPVGVLDYSVFVLFPRIRFNGTFPASFFDFLTVQLLLLLPGWDSYRPPAVFEYVGFDRCYRLARVAFDVLFLRKATHRLHSMDTVDAPV